MTPAERDYLAAEEVAEEKSEYVRGRICPRPGGTADHAAISVSLGAALRGRGRLVMSCNMKVQAAGQMYYPDLSVVCGPRQYRDGSRTVITNPILIAEVLSPTTERKDHGEKFRDYLTVESLMVYLLVSQDVPRVEQFSRAEDGCWDYRLVTGLESVLAVPALSVSLNLADIYDQIEFVQGADDEA